MNIVNLLSKWKNKKGTYCFLPFLRIEKQIPEIPVEFHWQTRLLPTIHSSDFQVRSRGRTPSSRKWLHILWALEEKITCRWDVASCRCSRWLSDDAAGHERGTELFAISRRSSFASADTLTRRGTYCTKIGCTSTSAAAACSSPSLSGARLVSTLESQKETASCGSFPSSGADVRRTRARTQSKSCLWYFLRGLFWSGLRGAKWFHLRWFECI